MKLATGWWIFIGGLLILGCGLLYDVLFAGIPYQDPPPYLRERYAQHARIAKSLFDAGSVLAAAGLVVAGVQWFLRPRRSKKFSSPLNQIQPLKGTNGSWAYHFFCDLSLYEMEKILVQSGPWKWWVRDCAWYPDFLQSNPNEDIRICIDKMEKDETAYRCLIESRSGSGLNRASIDPLLHVYLAKLPMRDLQEVPAFPWPYD